MSINRNFALAGAMAATLGLSAGAMAAEPVKLSDAQMENVTAGLDFVRGRFNFSNFRINNADLIADGSGIGALTQSVDQTIINAGTGITSFLLVGSAVGEAFADIRSTAGNGEVRLRNLNTFGRIEY